MFFFPPNSRRSKLHRIYDSNTANNLSRDFPGDCRNSRGTETNQLSVQRSDCLFQFRFSFFLPFVNCSQFTGCPSCAHSNICRYCFISIFHPFSLLTNEPYCQQFQFLVLRTIPLPLTTHNDVATADVDALHIFSIYSSFGWPVGAFSKGCNNNNNFWFNRSVYKHHTTFVRLFCEAFAHKWPIAYTLLCTHVVCSINCVIHFG